MAEAIDQLSAGDVDCVVSDYDMPGQNGLALLRRVRSTHPDLPFLLFTGKGSEEVASEAISSGATDYLQKERGVDQYTVLANRIVKAFERHASQRELHEATELYEATLQNISDTVLITDDAGRHTYVCPNVHFIFGHSAEDVEAMGEIDELIDTTVFEYQTVEEHEELSNVETTITTARGEERTVLVTIRSVSIRDGTRLYTIRDITDRKRQEREQQREHQRFRAIFEESFDAMVLADDSGRHIRANDRAEALFDVPDGGLVGRSIEEFSADGFDFEGAWDRFHEVTSERGTFALQRGDGTVRLVEYAATTDVVPGEHLSVIRDITQRVERERELERQRARLEEFASVVSHDLRNPLSVAMGRLGLVQKECSSEHLDPIESALERMEHLIDDRLALPKQGSEVDEFESVDIETLARSCWMTVDTANASLVVDIEQTIQADKSRLRQLLENLIRNAIEHGGDDVTVTIGEMDHGFFLADTGPGIPEAEWTAVFEPGYTSSAAGTGFGFAIVKRIAEAHGWEVRVKHAECGGAKFEVLGVTTE